MAASLASILAQSKGRGSRRVSICSIRSERGRTELTSPSYQHRDQVALVKPWEMR